jgi:hypothetical protein
MLVVGTINRCTARTHLADVVFGDMVAVSGCFPNALIPKNEQERLPIRRPATAGVEVACATELVQVEEQRTMCAPASGRADGTPDV